MYHKSRPDVNDVKPNCLCHIFENKSIIQSVLYFNIMIFAGYDEETNFQCP